MQFYISKSLLKLFDSLSGMLQLRFDGPRVLRQLDQGQGRLFQLSLGLRLESSGPGYCFERYILIDKRAGVRKVAVSRQRAELELAAGNREGARRSDVES